MITTPFSPTPTAKLSPKKSTPYKFSVTPVSMSFQLRPKSVVFRAVPASPTANAEVGFIRVEKFRFCVVPVGIESQTKPLFDQSNFPSSPTANAVWRSKALISLISALVLVVFGPKRRNGKANQRSF